MSAGVEPQLKLKDLLSSAAFMPAYLVASGAVTIAVLYASWFGLQHGLPLSKDPGDWGTFGDYFGGVMNPICAYMAFIWLVRSYALQKTELSETRKALEESLKAQQEQARLSLVSAKTGSLNIRLTALGATLASLRTSHSRVLTHLDRHGDRYPIRGDDGVMIDAKPALSALYSSIENTVRAQNEVMEALDAISASHDLKA